MAERILSETPELIVWGEDGPLDGDRPAWTSKRVEWKPGTTGGNEADMRAGLAQAMGALDTFIKTPPANITTVDQLVPVVKLLCRVARRLIRLQLRQLDGTD